MMLNKKTRNSLISTENTTLISEGATISGEIKFSGCLEIEGTIKGNIVTSNEDNDSQVRIKNTGKIFGDICAPDIMVNGQVTGNIYSSSRVEMVENAQVNGDVHYKIIEMMEGSQVNGSLIFSGESHESDLDKSISKSDITEEIDI